MQKAKYALIFFFAVTMIAGCSGLRKARVHPLVGTWDYAVDAMGQEYPGTFVFTGAEELEGGTIASQMEPTGTPLDKLVAEEMSFSCEFDSGQMGVITIKGTIEGDAMTGTMTLQGMGDFPFTATRQAPVEE